MGRATGRATGLGLIAGLLWLGASPAGAIEFWDGRVQTHGFFESRMSFGNENFNAKNGIALYGWLQVLNIETEAELAPDGWGPFDMIAAYSRIEVKYDCIWNHACGMIPSAYAFGNQPKNLPTRVQTGRRTELAGSQITFDRRPYWFAKRQYMSSGEFYDAKAGQRSARSLFYGSTNAALGSASPGPDGILGPFQDIRNERGPNAIYYDGNWTDPTTGLPGDDDAGLYMFNRTSKCKVGNWTQKASNQKGFSNRELMWSIDSCPIKATGFTRHVANPFRDESYGTEPTFGGDVNPVLLATNVETGQPLDPNGNGIPDSTALPLRPGSERNINDSSAKAWESQGLWVPNLVNRRKLRNGDFSGTDQNFSINDLQWNHGASQSETREFKEYYLEFEAFDSRLWVRAGKQTVVWGKTELFRNQDQWNPVDIAIGPLASLEESRIPLYMLRGIWSFYEVGPLEDVRLELVGLFDEFEPTDIGRCGEPWVPRLACNKAYGIWVHGENGTGVAGEIRPPDPWSNIKGSEAGARVEFRYDRFSFAVTDYWGFQDTANTPVLFNYDRNVDPVSGRPRHTQTTDPCPTGTEPACLYPGHAPLKPNESGDVVWIHSINQSLFAWICQGTVGVAPAVDPSACAFTLFNSPVEVIAGSGLTFATFFSQILAGSGTVPAGGGAGTLGAGNYRLLVDGFPARPPPDAITGPDGAINRVYPSLTQPLVNLVINQPPTGVAGGLERTLTPEQQALYGCGPFYFTNCDANGIDLGNADASVILQSFPWFEGTYFDPSWDTTDPTLPQPGTVDAVFNDGPGGGADAPFSKPGGIETGPAGSRWENGKAYVLPGAHYDPAAFTAVLANAAANGIQVNQWVLDNLAGYDMTKDGSVGCETPAGCRRQPFTGQIFASEMAISSWNLLMLAASLGDEVDTTSLSVLDPHRAFALGRCSFRQPQYCAFVSGLAAQARLTRNDIRAGGNGRFGRRQFVWASVGDIALDYQKRNIIGFSTDFAEDTTKSSWGIEFTYAPHTLAADNDAFSGLSEVNEYNLTLSVDRPTFINFLNANRTFFINSQVFMSYLQNYGNNMLRDGPFTFLLLVNANTGYFQDRFLVSAAGVYDFTSQSAAFLPSVQYRFTENFSITIGAAVLAGGWKRTGDMGINNFSATSDTQINDAVYSENGISPVRDLDNFFFRLRYTF